MLQMTLRLPDELAARLKQAARDHGSSLNGYASAVPAAAAQGRPGQRGPRLSVFADSSALVKLYADEADHETIRVLHPLVAEFEADYLGSDSEQQRFVVMGIPAATLDGAARLVATHGIRAYDASSWPAPSRPGRLTPAAPPSPASTGGFGGPPPPSRST